MKIPNRLLVSPGFGAWYQSLQQYNDLDTWQEYNQRLGVQAEAVKQARMEIIRRYALERGGKLVQENGHYVFPDTKAGKQCHDLIEFIMNLTYDVPLLSQSSAPATPEEVRV